MSSFRTLEISDAAYSPPGCRMVTVQSPALGRRGDITFYNAGTNKSDVPVITLLHGVYGSHWAWMFSGGVHVVYEYLRKTKGLCEFVLAMPSDGLEGDGSGYLDRASGRFEKWIAEEVPQIAEIVVPGVSAASRHYIAGLSMGGYGALRIGCLYPERYSGASAHSAITRLEDFSKFTPTDMASDLVRPDSILDLAELYTRHADTLPPFRFDCGTDDLLVESNRYFHSSLTKAGIPHDFSERPGIHDWAYWHSAIDETFSFFNRLERQF